MAETDSRVLEFLEEGLFLYGVGKVQEAIQRWRKVLELDTKNERALDYIESAGGDVSAYRARPANFVPAVVAPPATAAPIAPAAAPAKVDRTQPGMPSPVAAKPVQSPPPGSATVTQPSRPPPPAVAPPPPSGVPSIPRGGFPTAPVAATPPTPPPRVPVPPPAAAPPPVPAASAAETRDELLRKAAALYRAQQYEVSLELLERVARDFPPMDDTLRGYLDATRTAVLQGLRGTWSRMDQVPKPRLAPTQMMQLKLTPEAGFLLSRVDGMSTIEELIAVSGLEELAALRALTSLVQTGAIELTG